MDRETMESVEMKRRAFEERLEREEKEMQRKRIQEDQLIQEVEQVCDYKTVT